MTRERRHVGSGRRPVGDRVIPARWQRDHATVVGDTFTSTVTIGPASSGAPVFDPGAGISTTPPGVPVYDGRASIMPLTDPGQDEIAATDEPVSEITYEIGLPWDAPVEISTDHVIRVTDDPDPDLIGKFLQITAIGRGSQRFSRVLTATLNH